MEERKIKCCVCGAMIDENEIRTFDGSHMCSECFEDDTVECRYCGERIWRGDAVDEDLCESCYETHYVRCVGCDTVIHNCDAYYEGRDHDNEYPYCGNCYSRRSRWIHPYDYKPLPTFFGTDEDMFFGVELEIDAAGTDEDNAEEICNVANAEDNILYAKRDSSLSEGLELVSEPMTLQYHLKNAPWSEILKTCIRLKYVSYKAGTCGLHIHVNKNALGDTYSEIEDTTGRLVHFYEKFYPELLKFSRRTESQASRWAARYGNTVDTCKKSLDTAKKSGVGRYAAVNLTCDNTIEFRLFRGSLRLETFYAALELTHYLCHLAKRLSDEEFETITWGDFLNGIDGELYSELLAYLKTRGLGLYTEVV